MMEKENFHRFCGVLLDIGAKVLREVFSDKYVRTSTLAGYLACHKQKLTGLLPNTLRKDQFDLLYPPGVGVPVIEDLDITLLCFLFRNLDTQITPYDSVWTDPQTHQTYQADVTRIRLVRNMLFGHVKSTLMSNTTYNKEVSNLTTIYHRLVLSLSAGRMSSTELQEMIDRELNGPLQMGLDSKVKRLEEEMQKLHEHVEEFRKAVEANQEETQKHIKEVSEKQEDTRKDIQERQLETSRQWDSLSRYNGHVEVEMDKMKKRIALSKEVLDGHRDHAGEFFVGNERYRIGKEILDLHGKILITGNPGQGKTYLAYQLLLKFLQKKKNVRPLIISFADEWIKLVDPSTELGIVVDDMCGKYGLLQNEVKNWNENARFITALIDNRKHTMIFTMRTHTYEESSGHLQLVSDISDPLCLTNITLNLENDRMTLREADKIEFATRYLKEFGLTKDEVLKLCRISQASVGFPLLCRAAQRMEDKSKLINLFTRPLEIMLRELKCLRANKSVSYGTLVLAMLAGGTLTSKSIDEYSATNDRVKEVKLIFDSCGVPDVKLVDIQLAANALCRTHLLFNESDESYSFVHDTTEEAVFLSYGKLHQGQTLKLCSLRSVCKLCGINNQSQGSNVQASALMLHVRPTYYGILIERFITALETKSPRDFATLAEANVWSSDQFRKLFMDTCKTIHVLADKNQNSLLVHAANANNCDLASELLRGMKQFRAENQQQAVSYLTKAAKASCVHKDLCLFKQFMKTDDVNGSGILSLTVETGSEEAMVFLLQNGADINYTSGNGESLLHTACLHGRLHMVKVLQTKYSLSVNQLDRKGRSVCHSAASGGNVDILNFLIQKGASPMCKDADEMNLLQYACLEGKKDMAFYLTDNYSNMLCNVGKGGFTVLHCAAYGGNIDILNRVCELMNVSSRTDYNSRLNVSSRPTSGFFKSIFNSLYKLINAHSREDSNKHSDYTCHSEEKESHHGKQADLKARTTTEETLLHMACLSGKLEMTKHLVEKYRDMINEVDNRKGTPAHYAAESGNVFLVQYLIDEGLNPWCKTVTQETLLHKSCLAGQLEMTKYLAEKYTDMIHEEDSCKETLAHYAAQSSNVSVLQYLIDQGLDPQCRTDTQQTLLHKSCIRGQLEMTQYLLGKYPDMISAVDSCKRTPAHYAAESNNVLVFQYLIDQGLDPWYRTVTQETFLHKSCFAGQLEMTHYLLGKYPDMINAVDNCKGTPAHYAAESSNVSVLEYLIDQGFDPWCKTDTQETLLHRSCFAGQLEMTMYLIEKYPDMINQVDDCEETPAHYAAQGSNVSVLQYLFSQEQDPWCISARQETLLHKSCIKGQLEITQYLLEKYPDLIKEVDNCKRTPAHYAVESGNISVLQYLIDQGHNLWCRTDTQETLLHRACFAGQLEMSKYLVEKYPDMINEVDDRKGTPAHYAAESGNVSVLKYLIDQGLNPCCRTATQETLLHRACFAGQLEMSMYLLEKYPDMISEVDYRKGTPAHDAAESGNVPVLKYLIDQGLNPWCRTATQETLLHMSCFAGQLEMSKFLVEKYPDMIHELDNCKTTPAHCAAQSGNVPVLQYVIGQGLKPYCRTSTQQTVLHISCKTGQLEMTQYLFEKYPNMIKEVDNFENTPAQCAAQGGNVSVLQYLIGQGLDPRCRTPTQHTLLHLSCISGQLEMTQYLVEKYPDMIQALDKCNRTLAHHAAESGNVPVLQFLTGQGLDPWCTTSAQQTLLHMACRMGQLEMTRYLVETYFGMMKEADNCKGTPAHSAAFSGNVSLLQYLINQGIDPGCKTDTQQTLLHMSCMNGRLEMTQYLVNRYPNMVKELDNCKRTPAHYAVQSSNVSILLYLIDQGLDPWCRTTEQYTLLHMSCLTGQLEMTKYLVEKYPDMINEVDNLENTPAHCAALGGNVSVLQYLIGQGIDPRCRTPTQQTLLHISCFKGQLEITQYLVEKYPHMIKEVDNLENTPAHCAALGGNVSVLQYLIGQGLDPRCRTHTKDTLLHLSCITGQLGMTQYLVEKYPDMIHELDNCKRTPAHHAAKSGNVPVLKCLTDHGLSPRCRTASQETLLHRSCCAGQFEMSKYLVQKYPVMINELDNLKRTPAHHAAESGNVPILQYLTGQGLNPWCRTSTQQTLLHMACIKGQLEMTRYLFEKYPNMIKEVDNLENTPVQYAAQGGNVSVLQYLISQELNPRCRTTTQQTLLHMACIKGKLEMTRYLVETYFDMIEKVDNCKGTPAHSAAFSGNVSLLQYLINQGIDPGCKTDTQQTLLHMSCVNGRLEMTQYLVNKYPNMVKELDNCKRTPSHYAVQSSNVSVLLYLIDQGLDPWCRTTEQYTLLHMSCLTGQLEMTKYLVEKYPDMINEIDNLGNTPVQCAALGGNVSVLQYLIGQGIDPWCRTATQQTLLHISCFKGQFEITKYLVEKYPDMIKEVDNLENTPVQYVALGGNVSVLQYLIGQGLCPRCRTASQETLLHRSCCAGQFEMSKYLVQKYPDMINELDNLKRTPAHHAAESGNVPVLQYLTRQGLNPWCRTSAQQTLLHMACIKGQLTMTRYLFEKYPNMIKEVDNLENTPVQYAAQGGNVSVLEYLISQGIDPECKTDTQQTLLHMSCMNGRLEMTQYLVNRYPNMVKELDICKRTPAHYAVQSSNVSVLLYLIDQGLDPWCRTIEQYTLLHMSCLVGQLEMTKYLVEKYPDMINEIDIFKNTPAHCVALGGYVSVLQYLIGQGLDPRCRTPTQHTLLDMSSIHGQLGMTQFLVEKYPDMIHELANCTKTPAHHAAENGNVSVLKFLIDQGLDPRCRTATQETLLHMSCFAAQLEMSKYLVEKYPDMIHELDNYKRTPAHCAAARGNVSVLKYLINQGLAPKSRTAKQQTLLHMSCFGRQSQERKRLVENYPDMIQLFDNCKTTPAHGDPQSGNVPVLQSLISSGLKPHLSRFTYEILHLKSYIQDQLEMTQYLVEKYPYMLKEVDNLGNTPVQCAAQGGNVSVLQYLIGQGLDPWCRTSEQLTLLHLSCINGQLEMTQYLVEKYPDMLKEVDNLGNTPVQCAAQGGNVSVLQYLIDQGLDPWCKTDTQQTLLHMSCVNGRLEMTQYLVNKYPNMVKELDNCKRTPSHYAVQSSNVSVLLYLIDQGLDPWCRTTEQYTLLHMSCLTGQLETTKYLVEKYPDMLKEVDNLGNTPVQCAAQGGNVSVLQYLIGQGLDPWCRTSKQLTLLHLSCINGQLEMTQNLVEKYPDMLKEVDNLGNTPVQCAAQGGNVSVLQYLIGQGLDPWCRTSEQLTLLHLSCINGQLEMTQYLVEKYPDMLKEVDNLGNTPVQCAALGGNVSVLQYLIDQGLDPWCRTSKQQTLLYMACIKGKLEMTRYLVETYFGMIKKVGNCKDTPAIAAAFSGNVSLLQYLINQGIDPGCKTDTQQTLLHMSCMNGRLEMTQYLVNKYPDMVKELDNCKRTPAHYAVQSSNKSVLQYLSDLGLYP